MEMRIRKEREDGERREGEVRKRLEMEIGRERERCAVEKEEWMGRMMVKFEGEMKERDKQLREKLLKERDAELEMIIERLEADTNSNAGDLTKRHRVEIEKLKSEFNEEVKQLKDQHNLALDRVIASQAELSKCEDQKREMQKMVMQLRHELEAKEMMLKSQKTDLARLQVDETTLQRTIRNDFEEHLRAKDIQIRQQDDAIAKLSLEVELIRRESKASLEAAVREKESALSLVEERVRRALAAKEEQCRRLKGQVEELVSKNRHLGELIEKQRMELLS
ncbi:hypothetical protein HDU67_000755 [Dinochytrium kinnereticum]|nr:hypothetical protein HDU67_000755 [Dinochytrium kinnereticum]